MNEIRFKHILACSIVLAAVALTGEAVAWLKERGVSATTSGTSTGSAALVITARPTRVTPGSTAASQHRRVR